MLWLQEAAVLLGVRALIFASEEGENFARLTTQISVRKIYDNIFYFECCIFDIEELKFLSCSLCCTGKYRGLREIQIVCKQTGGAQSTRTC